MKELGRRTYARRCPPACEAEIWFDWKANAGEVRIDREVYDRLKEQDRNGLNPDLDGLGPGQRFGRPVSLYFFALALNEGGVSIPRTTFTKLVDDIQGSRGSAEPAEEADFA